MQFVGTGDFASGPTVLPPSPTDYLNPLGGSKYGNQVPVELVAPPGMPPGLQYPAMPMYAPYQGQGNGQGYYPMMYYQGGGGGQWPNGYIPQTYMPIDNSTYYAVDQHGNYILLPQQPGMQNPVMTEPMGNAIPPSNVSSEVQLIANGPPTMPEDMEVDGKPIGGQFDDSHGRSTTTSLHRKNQKFRPNAVYKTLMCTMYEEHGRCTYGLHCQYAHGPEELRPNLQIPHPKYKTQMCNKFSTPHGCQYGDKCHFRHPDDPAPTFTQSHVQTRSNTFYEPNPAPNPPKSALRHRKDKLQNGNAPPTHVKSQQKQSVNPPPKQFGASSDVPEPVAPKEDDSKPTKESDCLLKLSMYHHFENYIGKNRKPATLTRSNSCNTVSSFTFVRFVSMQKLVTDQVFRMSCKKNAIGIGKKDSLTTPQTPLTAKQ